MAQPAIRLSSRTIRAVLEALAGAPGSIATSLIDLVGRERPISAAQAATIPRPVLTTLCELGVVDRTADGWTPRARLDRVDALLVSSDLRRHRRSPDFVVGPGPASFLLARHVRPSRGRVLDLGCGSGIQGLLAGDRRTEVTAIDINPRALAYASFNAALNGRPRIECKLGDFLAHERDRSLDGRFATVIANPPFVLAPRFELTYRDRTLRGDEVGARTVDRVARSLAPGGRGYVLCNWIDRLDVPAPTADGWLDPIRTWLMGLGTDAVVSRLADFEPSAYAELWTRDLAPGDRPSAIARWTAGLDAEGVRRIHLGVIALARPIRGQASSARVEWIDGRVARPSWQAVEELLDGRGT